MEHDLPTPADDDDLLRDLRHLMSELDPIPGPVRDAAHAAIGWRTIDAELAQLTADYATGAGFVCFGAGSAAASSSS